LRADLTRAIGSGLTQRTGDIRTLAAALAALSPQGTLDRGYGIVRDPTGAIVRDADLVAPGQTVHIRLARGELTAKRQPSEPAAPTPSGQRG
jgi:exodeoxyribonuclease VII large subunit